MGWRHGWTQRHLTPEGLQALGDSVSGAGLPSCRTVYRPDQSEFVSITVETDTGPVLLEFGPVANETQPNTDAELAAAGAIVARFADTDLELPTALWLDADWAPLDAQRWAVFVAFESLEGSQPQTAFWDATLPDGSTLRTFGEELPHRSSGSSPTRRAVSGTTTESGRQARTSRKEHARSAAGWSPPLRLNRSGMSSTP